MRRRTKAQASEENVDVEWTSWIGRRERSADRVTAAPAAALAATLDRDDPLLAMAVTATLA